MCWCPPLALAKTMACYSTQHHPRAHIVWRRAPAADRCQRGAASQNGIVHFFHLFSSHTHTPRSTLWFSQSTHITARAVPWDSRLFVCMTVWAIQTHTPARSTISPSLPDLQNQSIDTYAVIFAHWIFRGRRHFVSPPMSPSLIRTASSLSTLSR